MGLMGLWVVVGISMGFGHKNDVQNGTLFPFAHPKVICVAGEMPTS